MSTSHRARVTLASQSRYKRSLLERLLRHFDAFDPAIDEAPRPQEPAAELAQRLAKAKASAADTPAGRIIIGADQVAAIGPACLGKPLTREQNIEMLSRCSGRVVIFYTAVCVACPGADSLTHCDATRVEFLDLTTAEIERYVDFDQAFDCAGGFKIESAAPALLASVSSCDPTALMGLPLIWLASALKQCGVSLPG